MKKCSKCGVEKELKYFYKRKDSKDGYRSECKECKNKVSKEWALLNKDKVKKIKRKYYDNNKENVIERTKIWQIENKERYKEISKKYRNKKSVKERIKKKYNENKDYILLRNKRNRYKYKERANKKHKERYENDTLYKLKYKMRNIIKKSIERNGYRKNSKTEEILGCNFEEFKLYLESKFEPWMTWENRGLYNGELNHGWDIDHIIPLHSAKNEDDLIRLNHYTNLQPLCSKINRDIKRLEDLKLYN